MRSLPRLRPAGPVLAAVPLVLSSDSLAPAARLAPQCEGDDSVRPPGSDEGVCLVDPGKTGVCIDGAADAVWASCEAGCLATHGTGACALPGEEAVGGSSVLSCPDGKRYLIRTGSGRGDCAVTKDAH